MAKSDMKSSTNKKANISMIAKEAGVSVSTISRFLNNSSYVGADTRKKINRVIEKYNYRPNYIAQSLARGNSRIIGILSTDLNNPCTADVVQGIINGCKGTGYSVLTAYNVPEIEAEQNMTDLLVRILVSGIIVLSETNVDSEDFVQHLTHIAKVRGIPVVLAGDRIGNTELDSVSYDSKRTGYVATRHLLEKGFERVGCITGSMRSLDGQQRYEGYRQALIEANIRFDPKLVYEGHFQQEDGYHGLYHFHHNKTMPRAIFCCNDYTAIGVFLAADELGIRIPQDLAVIGCDNIELSRLMSPKLSTINFDNIKNGEMLAKLIMQRVETPEAQRKTLLLNPIVIERDSTRVD